jgi:hypothetical protein
MNEDYENIKNNKQNDNEEIINQNKKQLLKLVIVNFNNWNNYKKRIQVQFDEMETVQEFLDWKETQFKENKFGFEDWDEIDNNADTIHTIIQNLPKLKRLNNKRIQKQLEQINTIREQMENINNLNIINMQKTLLTYMHDHVHNAKIANTLQKLNEETLIESKSIEDYISKMDESMILEPSTDNKRIQKNNLIIETLISKLPIQHNLNLKRNLQVKNMKKNKNLSLSAEASQRLISKQNRLLGVLKTKFGIEIDGAPAENPVAENPVAEGGGAEENAKLSRSLKQLSNKFKYISLSPAMYIGVLSAVRAFLLITADIEENPSGGPLIGLSRRLFVRDVLFSGMVVGMIQFSGMLTYAECAEVIVVTAAGCILAAAALFLYTSADPPRCNIAGRRIAAAAGILLPWIVWVQSKQGW